MGAALWALATLAIWGLQHNQAFAAQWKPTEQLEMIIPTKAGSGVDNTARTVQAILQANKLVPSPIIALNKPGGGYAVAMGYLDRFPGDGHRLFVQTSTPLAGFITGQLKFNYFDFTPIANLINEPVAFMVRPDSPIKDAKGLVARLKKDPGAVTIGIAAARGNAFHITAALLARAANIDPNRLMVVVFTSSSDGMAQVMGGHVDMFLATPANFKSLLEAGRIRMIGMSSLRRLDGVLATVPTFKEQGLDVQFSVWRGVLGAKGLSPAQVAYWDDAFGRMANSKEWRQAVEKNGWVSDYKNSRETKEYIKAEHELLKSVLMELGMVK
ncbi:MAG: hypothetical protein A3G24_12090 [Betaproteobacteria bacterium RIFCSPLOWO2_12_FULL_62_13]|nr:MAG: hypothetical protein A3G24_12090 [Betaproteobacteria bacterium RIFCSPLOWO2_12_FULL_62_13]